MAGPTLTAKEQFIANLHLANLSPAAQSQIQQSLDGVDQTRLAQFNRDYAARIEAGAIPAGAAHSSLMATEHDYMQMQMLSPGVVINPADYADKKFAAGVSGAFKIAAHDTAVAAEHDHAPMSGGNPNVIASIQLHGAAAVATDYVNPNFDYAQSFTRGTAHEYTNDRRDPKTIAEATARTQQEAHTVAPVATAAPSTHQPTHREAEDKSMAALADANAPTHREAEDKSMAALAAVPSTASATTVAPANGGKLVFKDWDAEAAAKKVADAAAQKAEDAREHNHLAAGNRNSMRIAQAKAPAAPALPDHYANGNDQIRIYPDMKDGKVVPGSYMVMAPAGAGPKAGWDGVTGVTSAQLAKIRSVATDSKDPGGLARIVGGIREAVTGHEGNPDVMMAALNTPSQLEATMAKLRAQQATQQGTQIREGHVNGPGAVYATELPPPASGHQPPVQTTVHRDTHHHVKTAHAHPHSGTQVVDAAKGKAAPPRLSKPVIDQGFV